MYSFTNKDIYIIKNIVDNLNYIIHISNNNKGLIPIQQAEELTNILDNILESAIILTQQKKEQNNVRTECCQGNHGNDQTP